MRKGLVGAAMAIVIIALVVVVAVLELQSDKTPPEITCSEQTLVYSLAEDKSALLVDVTAYDEEDGNVTDNLAVESIYDFHNGTAQVIYVAKDSSGNISKKERIISLTDSEVIDTQEVTDDAVDVIEGDVPEEGQNQWQEVTGENPVINLTTDTVRIAVGDSSFNRMNYIANMADDVDDSNVLSRRVRIDGDYNVNEAGTYTLTYYVTDTDGNMSNQVVLTLIVE